MCEIMGLRFVVIKADLCSMEVYGEMFVLSPRMQYPRCRWGCTRITGRGAVPLPCIYFDGL